MEVLIFLYIRFKANLMKKTLLTVTLLLCSFFFGQAQTTLRGAETFHVQLPANFIRAIGVNDLASVQWEHTEKEIYGYIIFENTAEMKLAELDLDLKQYAELCLNDFSDIEQYQLLKTENYTTTNGLATIEHTIRYQNTELDTMIMMQINAYKTPHFYYKLIQFGDEATFKAYTTDLKRIAKEVQFPH